MGHIGQVVNLNLKGMSVDPYFFHMCPHLISETHFRFKEKLCFIKIWSHHLLLFIFKGEIK